MQTREILPKPVYYIESDKDRTVLIVVRVRLEYKEFDGERIVRVTWYDMIKERAMTAVEIKRDGDLFAFRRSEQEGGGEYYFTPMDLEIYDNKVKDKLLSGREFDSNEAVVRGFLEAIRDGLERGE